MSALPPKADIDHDASDVRFVPEADTTLHLIRLAPAVMRQGSNGLPYRIVQIGTWPGPY
jgi:hypothetical protein